MVYFCACDGEGGGKINNLFKKRGGNLPVYDNSFFSFAIVTIKTKFYYISSLQIAKF